MTSALLRPISARVWREVFIAPRNRTVSQWADEERYLSQESANVARFGPVPWDTNDVPYLREVMDSLSDPEVEEVTFAKASQVGGSEAGFNWIGWMITDEPGPILTVWPTEKALKAWSLKRFDPMLRDTPVLRDKISRSARRESSNSIASKHFPGGYIQALTARSTTDLRSFSARRAVAEEFDEWEGDVGDQGDPLELLRRRLSTFSPRTLYKVSTPLLEGSSRIWSELELSSWGEYHVPCPHCNAEQVLVWQDAEERYRIICEHDEEGHPIAETAKYCCIACSALIDESQKLAMLQAGRWIHRHPERRRHRGFHVNQITSPLSTWAEVMLAFIRSKGDPLKLKTFVNTVLGLPFREDGTQIEPHVLQERAEEYPRQGEGDDALELVPPEVRFLTAGVDVQGDRLELEVWGWGPHREAWVISWEQLEGDPGRPEVWNDLWDRFRVPALNEAGAQLRIVAACFDANYQTDAVHNFVDRLRNRYMIPTIGRAGRGRPLLQAPGPAKRKRTGGERRPSFIVGSDAGKDLLASLLRIRAKPGEPGPHPGLIHFPTSLDPVFYDQLTAEKLVTVYVKGRPERTWKLIEGRRNEALDMAVLNLAALTRMGRDGMARMAGPPPTAPAAPDPKEQGQPSRPSPRRSKWVSGWKERW